MPPSPAGENRMPPSPSGAALAAAAQARHHAGPRPPAPAKPKPTPAGKTSMPAPTPPVNATPCPPPAPPRSTPSRLASTGSPRRTRRAAAQPNPPPAPPRHPVPRPPAVRRTRPAKAAGPPPPASPDRSAAGGRSRPPRHAPSTQTRKEPAHVITDQPPRPRPQNHLRSLKLGKLTATLPERLTLARQSNMTHADFLQLVLADEVTRRESGSTALRARTAGLDPAIAPETWDATASIRYDQQLWNELVSLRFLDGHHGALILGPVGVGKTHLATALGHIAVRRRRTVHMARADQLFKRLKPPAWTTAPTPRCAAWPPSSCSSWTTSRSSPSTPRHRRLLRDLTDRHRKDATIVTSNRDASEWLALMTDPLLAQSAVDRLTSTCHELIVEGESYRRRQRPARTQS